MALQRVPLLCPQLWLRMKSKTTEPFFTYELHSVFSESGQDIVWCWPLTHAALSQVLPMPNLLLHMAIHYWVMRAVEHGLSMHPIRGRKLLHFGSVSFSTMRTSTQLLAHCDFYRQLSSPFTHIFSHTHLSQWASAKFKVSNASGKDAIDWLPLYFAWRSLKFVTCFLFFDFFCVFPRFYILHLYF